MGLFLSKMIRLFEDFANGEPTRILMLGLDAAGKTTILYKVKLNDNVCTIPTIGFNVETVSPARGVTFTVWDVGGQKKIRELWKHYFQNTQGLFYVVDSADRLRMKEASEELLDVCDAPDMAGVPVVIVANKQDLPGACKTSEVADLLGMHQFRNRKWYIQGACALTGDGIYEAMNEMSRLVKEFKKSSH